MKLSSPVSFVLIFASVASSQTTKPSPPQLHLQAIDLMRAGQYPKAMPLLEQAYRATPPAQLARPLVLNRAMLDVMQKVNAMRAAKDLRDYLRLHPEPDDQAANILGAALQTACAKNTRVQQNDVFQSAAKQLDLAVASLEQARPDTKKWGSKWYGKADFSHLRWKVETTTDHWRFEQDRADHEKADWNKAMAEVQRYNTINTNPVHAHRNGVDQWNCPICIAARQNVAHAETARRDASDAESRYKAQQQVADRARAMIPQPDWNVNLAPLDLSAVVPAPPPPVETVAPAVPDELSGNTPKQ